MKVAIITLACFAAVFTQETPNLHKSKPLTRALPADVLRDFPTMCFASTACRVFQVGESWPLNPFCGEATCVAGPGGQLIEQVSDCGIPPKNNTACQLYEIDLTNTTFPDCCPQFICEPGVKLEFPTPEELAAADAARAEAAKAGTPAAA